MRSVTRRFLLKRRVPTPVLSAAQWRGLTSRQQRILLDGLHRIDEVVERQRQREIAQAKALLADRARMLVAQNWEVA